MEDIYTIKVKTKPDTRNLYPSERRYSASTVSGLAWVHIALAATSFLLACLAIVSPDNQPNTKSDNVTTLNETDDLFNSTELHENYVNSTIVIQDYGFILVLAPSLLTMFALLAGLTSIMASVRWYIDHNITWLFVVSLLSTIVSLVAFIMVAAWFVATSEENEISNFYKDKVPFKDYIVVKHTDVLDRNDSHFVIPKDSGEPASDASNVFTKSVLSINILIAAFLELLWSILSVKIAYKGMRKNYKDDDNERRGNCIAVVTTIKGNNTKNLPRNGKLLTPKPDLIDHYPSRKIKKIFLAQGDSGFYLKNQTNKTKQNTETSSEFYKERMMNFLNRCASLEGVSNPEIRTPSVQSENVLNAIPEVASVEINLRENSDVRDRITPVSWGDSHDHTIYNQNTINFDKIFKFSSNKEEGVTEAKATDVQPSTQDDNIEQI